MRSRFFLLIVGLLIAVGFLSFAFTKTVRFTEAAVISTFGSASEASVRTEPGLVLRWPIAQTVTIYDTRARILETRSETQQTADSKQIIVSAFLAWRVSDPLKFYQQFSGAGSNERRHYEAAERTLGSQLRSAMAEVSSYRLDQIFAADEKDSKLDELETKIRDRLVNRQGGSSPISDSGIQVDLVGISRVLLPEKTTKDVFNRMKAAQQRQAADAESRGEAQARSIVDAAESAAARIRSFAQARADEIRNRGDEEAAPYMAQLNEAPDLAVFLKQIDFMRDLYGKRATLLLPTTMPGMSVFDPDMLNKLGANGLPAFSLPSVRNEKTQEKKKVSSAEDAGR